MSRTAKEIRKILYIKLSASDKLRSEFDILILSNTCLELIRRNHTYLISLLELSILLSIIKSLEDIDEYDSSISSGKITLVLKNENTKN